MLCNGSHIICTHLMCNFDLHSLMQDRGTFNKYPLSFYFLLYLCTLEDYTL